jgi:carbamoyltransferase
MKIKGLSYGFHDAAVAVFEDTKCIFASSAERYTKVKNDPILPDYLKKLSADQSVYYEDHFKKDDRLKQFNIPFVNDVDEVLHQEHHWSHAAAGYFTRPFQEEPVCVVIDAVGEWDTTSIWYKGVKVHSWDYPRSLGLIYSAITQYIGLKPMEDEYITMGLAAYGEPIYDMSPLLDINCQYVLPPDIFPANARREDLAASVQYFTEKQIRKIMQLARTFSNHLVYGGGVALNCVANSMIYKMFDNVHIFPNPGDAGSAFGCAAALINKTVDWSPYMGYDIKSNTNPKEVVNELLERSVVGVANGKAEFGPRALGNRSLLADPRLDIKDTINDIKRRQRFRPFAPAILSEYAQEYFKGPMNQYMQFVAKAKHDYASVTHVDGTARVQVVEPECESVLRPILEEWYDRTGCPILLNTSLNIKGQPMVNDEQDVRKFERKYGVRVL